MPHVGADQPCVGALKADLAWGGNGTGTFEGCLVGETDLNGVRAVRPTVKGTASILGVASWTIDRSDPVGAGFLVG